MGRRAWEESPPSFPFCAGQTFGLQLSGVNDGLRGCAVDAEIIYNDGDRFRGSRHERPRQYE